MALWFVHQGRLAGVGGEDLPTIVVVAHYDSFGVAPVCSLKIFFSSYFVIENLKCFIRKYRLNVLFWQLFSSGHATLSAAASKSQEAAEVTRLCVLGCSGCRTEQTQMVVGCPCCSSWLVSSLNSTPTNGHMLREYRARIKMTWIF